MLAIGVGFLGVRVADGTDTLDQSYDGAAWLAAWDACIGKQLDERVPAHARVYIPQDNPYWAQGLGAMAAPGLRVVEHLRDADYVITVGDATPTTPPSERCGREQKPFPPFPIGRSVTLVVMATS